MPKQNPMKREVYFRFIGFFVIEKFFLQKLPLIR